jgi:hypothetical protein
VVDSLEVGAYTPHVEVVIYQLNLSFLLHPSVGEVEVVEVWIVVMVEV